VCDYLNEHIAQEIKIETLAAMVLSPLHAWRFSKMSWGKRSMPGASGSASTAQGADSETSLPLNKIALSVGYEIRSISRAFSANTTAFHRASTETLCGNENGLAENINGSRGSRFFTTASVG
jgi:hypothetical protein